VTQFAIVVSKGFFGVFFGDKKDPWVLFSFLLERGTVVLMCIYIFLFFILFFCLERRSCFPFFILFVFFFRGKEAHGFCFFFCFIMFWEIRRWF
jgi:hypothetical protein